MNLVDFSVLRSLNIASKEIGKKKDKYRKRKEGFGLLGKCGF